MRTQLIASLVFACALLPVARAADFATKAEAEAMVNKGLKFLKANGKDKTYVEISKKDGQFSDRDLYLTVYGLDGVVRAHGANAKMIGKNLLEIKDVDGKAFVKERVELAKKNKPFWQDYKFTNPVSGQIEPKAMYCVPEDDMVVCGGVYLK
ncbi:cache domain-containing protein [Duganella sp. S19_KUP01_CR8]|uniref:cache domain-containing protein n=1 Tax=Duganella sp. S19_KUP01_CR8 TaxID=3025502 RepID=UPI002FCDB75A